MPECEFLQGCAFFNDKMSLEGGLGAIYKQRYCKGNFKDCARYMVATQLGREHVTLSLFPNMTEKARELIEASVHA